jgi:hypothetical protein
VAKRLSKTLVPMAIGMIVAVWVASASSSVPVRLEASRPFCPATRFQRPPSENTRSAEVLVPMAPHELLVCRYYGLNEPPGHPAGTLAAEGLLRRTAPTRSLAREFDALESFPDRPLHCPMDDGSTLLAIFRYRSQPEVPVEVSITGCGGAVNGLMPHAFFTSSRLQNRLKALTHFASSEH